MKAQESIDQTDLEILKILQEDSRTQYRKIVDLTGKSLGTISNRIQRMMDNGVIRSWTVMVDAEALGYDLTVIINIQIDVKYLDAVNRHLSSVPELIAIYNVTGDYDITAIARVKNRSHLDSVIHKIIEVDHIKRTSSNVVLRTLKEDFRVDVS